ncbi:MAG: hypothetical protein H8E21_00855 [Gammaproteobacteria bacterium]|nr:hypothetical protein [Gammaproteobacteria bacterium]MBL6999166.1 hypothetical protein [Gammaproteobacteria bacterium]
MFDILLSFQFVGISLLVILLSTVLAYACIRLHKKLLYIAAAEWLMEHVYCPLAKVLLLMLMAFLLFPMIFIDISYSQLSQLFLQTSFLLNMLNILFFCSLLFTFLPLLSHPTIAMPVLGCIATGLLFLHQIAIPSQLDFSWIPSSTAAGHILLLVLLTHLISRWLNNKVSEWIDLRFIVTGSKALITDINYLIFQIPVVLAYGKGLTLQLANHTL